MNYYNYFVTKNSQQYSIQKVISKLKTTFQSKKRTVEKNKFYINKKSCLMKGSTISLYCNDMDEPCYIKGVQLQSSADDLQNSFSSKFWKIHRKTLVLESLFNKVVGPKRLHHKYLFMIFAKLLRTPFNKTSSTKKIAMANLSQLSYTKLNK